MGDDDKQTIRFKIDRGVQRNEELRASLQALADEHGPKALMQEFAQWWTRDYSRGRGQPGLYRTRGVPRRYILKHLWIAVQIECYRRKKKVAPALKDLFDELPRREKKGWMIDAGGEEGLMIETAGTARKIYSHAQLLRRDEKVRRDWDRSLAVAKKIIDEGWPVGLRHVAHSFISYSPFSLRGTSRR